MTRVNTSTPPHTPTPIGPYSHIARVGEFITIGGTAGVDPATGQLAGPDAYLQTKQILDSFEVMLESAGSDLSHVTHVNVFLQRMADFDEMNRAYVEKMGEHRPARTVIGVTDLPKPGAVLTMNLTAVTKARPEVTIEALQAFADAWNRHDIDALMSFMTDDCVFESSAGPDICGTRYTGREAVRAGFAEVWTTFPDAHWGNARHLVQGGRGLSEWTFTGTRADGTRVEVHGCDVFTFRDGKIAVKNSYRKNRR